MVYELELHLKTWHATANINPPFREEGCNKFFMHSNDFLQSSFSKFLAIFFSVSFWTIHYQYIFASTRDNSSKQH